MAKKNNKELAEDLLQSDENLDLVPPEDFDDEESGLDAKFAEAFEVPIEAEPVKIVEIRTKFEPNNVVRRTEEQHYSLTNSSGYKPFPKELKNKRDNL